MSLLLLLQQLGRSRIGNGTAAAPLSRCLTHSLQGWLGVTTGHHHHKPCSCCTASTQQQRAASSSSSSSHQQSSGAAGSSSIRSDLGSGAALGSVPSSTSGSTTAQRRQSLLQNNGQRFYDTVQVQPCDAVEQPHSSSSSSTRGYQLLLHKYPVKTPAKNVLVLPTLSLALAVAAEWESLPSGKPAAHRMPLTGLACTAIDQPKEASKVIEHLLKYVHTDGACIRYESGPLERRQQRVFDPLLAWARDSLGWELHTCSSICGTTQPDDTVAAVQRYLEGLDAWHLAAMEQLVTSSKSLVISAAVLRGRLSVADAVSAARLEEDYQLEDWGMVEAGHDLDIADTQTRLGAPAVLTKLLGLP